MSFSTLQSLYTGLIVVSTLWTLFFGSVGVIDKLQKSGKIPIKIHWVSNLTALLKYSFIFASVGLAICVLILSTTLLIILLRPTEPPTGFTVTTLKDGQVIQNQNTPDNALTIQGTYSSEGSGHVWVVLQDKIGQYYLQNPPVKFLDGGKWAATNILVGKDITMVDFVYVTNQGNDTFQQMVNNGDFGAFNTLPEGSQMLSSIHITSLIST